MLETRLRGILPLCLQPKGQVDIPVMHLVSRQMASSDMLGLSERVGGLFRPAEEVPQRLRHHSLVFEISRLHFPAESILRAEVLALATIVSHLHAHLAEISANITTEALEVHLALKQPLQVLALLLCSHEDAGGDHLLSHNGGAFAKSTSDGVDIASAHQAGLPTLLAHDVCLNDLDLLGQLAQCSLHGGSPVGTSLLLDLRAMLSKAQCLQGFHGV
mmetsp:Transcript_60724/g.161327  ORF Transcript_60724/g.161327 Transcript_60724/m.161327 type:complete len:217 (+) Transcript_60724:610-1260(+)